MRLLSIGRHLTYMQNSICAIRRLKMFSVYEMNLYCWWPVNIRCRFLRNTNDTVCICLGSRDWDIDCNNQNLLSAVGNRSNSICACNLSPSFKGHVISSIGDAANDFFDVNLRRVFARLRLTWFINQYFCLSLNNLYSSLHTRIVIGLWRDVVTTVSQSNNFLLATILCVCVCARERVWYGFSYLFSVHFSIRLCSK